MNNACTCASLHLLMGVWVWYFDLGGQDAEWFAWFDMTDIAFVAFHFGCSVLKFHLL